MIPASFLSSIEEVSGIRIANYFDLIVGTSTGGIIAIGLGLGMSAKSILEFYERFGPNIFKTTITKKLIGHMIFSKYKSKPLLTALQDCFGEQKLGESKTRLVIPSLNLETGEVYIYKTSHHQRLQYDYKKSVVDIALATSSAPTFFPTHHTSEGIPLIDGGMWANNPTGLAVIEAIGVLGWDKESIKVLSLGCTTEPITAKSGIKWPWGKAYWAFKAVDVFLSAQSSYSLGTAAVLIGHENIIRISPYVDKGRFSLDSVKDIEFMKGLGAAEARKAQPEIKQNFLTHPAESFTPYNTL